MTKTIADCGCTFEKGLLTICAQHAPPRPRSWWRQRLAELRGAYAWTRVFR